MWCSNVASEVRADLLAADWVARGWTRIHLGVLWWRDFCGSYCQNGLVLLLYRSMVHPRGVRNVSIAFYSYWGALGQFPKEGHRGIIPTNRLQLCIWRRLGNSIILPHQPSRALWTSTADHHYSASVVFVHPAGFRLATQSVPTEAAN